MVSGFRYTRSVLHHCQVTICKSFSGQHRPRGIGWCGPCTCGYAPVVTPLSRDVVVVTESNAGVRSCCGILVGNGEDLLSAAPYVTVRSTAAAHLQMGVCVQSALAAGSSLAMEQITVCDEFDIHRSTLQRFTCNF